MNRVTVFPDPQGERALGGETDRRDLLRVMLLLLLGLGLRVLGIGSQSIWIDEVQSLDWAVKSAVTIVDEGAHYNQAPLYFLLLKAWVRLGSDSAIWTRLLSALLGAAMIPVLYWFGREQSIPRTPLYWATALLTVSPLAIWHSQDARMYSLMLVAGYATLALMLRYLRRGAPGCLWGFGIGLTASLYTHAYMVFLVPIIVLILVLRRNDFVSPRLRNTFVALMGVGIAYLPWAWVIVTTSAHEAGFYRPINPFTLPYTFFVFSVGYSLGPSVGELHQPGAAVPLLLRHWPAIATVTMLFGVAATAGIVSLRACSRAMRQTMVLLLTLPIVFPILVTFGTRVTYNVRYTIIAFPAFLLLVGIGLDALRPRAFGWGVGAGILALVAFSLYGYHADPRYAKEDTRAAFQWIEKRRRPGDCVVVQGVAEAYQYYERPRIHSRWIDLRGGTPGETVERSLTEWSRECDRFWLVSGREWEADPQGLVQGELDERYDRGTSVRFPGVLVTEFRSRAPDAVSSGRLTP